MVFTYIISLFTVTKPVLKYRIELGQKPRFLMDKTINSNSIKVKKLLDYKYKMA